MELAADKKQLNGLKAQKNVVMEMPSLLQIDQIDRPEWLHGLLTGKFFTSCQRHSASKKNEKNVFCVDCAESSCQHCLDDHAGHKLLQIRRYVYHDVVRMQEITKLVDCSGVQTYIINSAKVIFLNQRPQPRPTKGYNSCKTCDRSLQDDYKYCSLCCKVEAVLRSESTIRPLLLRCTSLPAIEIRASSPVIKCSPSDIEMNDANASTTSSTASLDVVDPSAMSSDSNENEEGGFYYTSSANFYVAPRRIRTTRATGFHPYSSSPESPSKIEISPRNRRKGHPQRSPAF